MYFAVEKKKQPKNQTIGNPDTGNGNKGYLYHSTCQAVFIQCSI
jgi:hypothetical protein